MILLTLKKLLTTGGESTPTACAVVGAFAPGSLRSRRVPPLSEGTLPTSR
jgi:hypothetical protein